MGEVLRGKVKHLVSAKGFGFIEPDGKADGGEDVFLHKSGMAKGFKFDDLAIGDVMTFELDEQKPGKGPRATKAQPDLR